jgi:predicted AlkP superfamily phosphohydrolase/phosphomutase
MSDEPLLNKFRVETFATYFRLIDVVSHFAAEFIDPALIEQADEEEKIIRISPQVEQALNSAFSQVVKPIYIFQDKILGELLQLTSPQTTVIICSDHSFYYHQKSYNHMEEPRLAPGIILMKGPHIKKGYKIQKAHIYDILPTILYLLNLPVAEDMDGQVLLEAFKESYLQKNPIKRIKTYESKKPFAEKKGDRAMDKKLLEELRALGYIK